MTFSFDKVPLATKPMTRVVSIGKVAPLLVSDSPLRYRIAKDWSKPFAARVRLARTSEEQWDEAQLATLEAVVRRLVRSGWTRRRTSKDRTRNRATSRYLIKNNYEIRISNHFLRYRKWSHEYVITDKVVQTYNVLGIIQWIERDYQRFLSRRIGHENSANGNSRS
jgi:hypothetical protein